MIGNKNRCKGNWGASLFVVACLAVGQAANAARVYFTDQPGTAAGSVVSVAPDGTDQRTVVTAIGTTDLRGIAYHHGAGRVYYVDNGPAKRIYSILPDGTGQQEVLPLNPVLTADLELDEGAGKIYWAETGSGAIMRANLNGTGIETAVAPGTNNFNYTAPYFFFVDVKGSNLYWGVTGDAGTSNFRRSTFAGAIDAGFLITSQSRTRDIAIDPGSAMAYWCDRQTGSIFKRALSGGANVTVIAGMNAPHGIALDVEAEKIYWADTGARGSGPSNTSARRVARCNFDGTGYENLSTPTAISEVWDVALDLSSRSYADWRPRFFSTSSAASGPMDDADGDGAVNLLEYALVTNPTKASSVPALAAEGTRLRYTRRRGSNLTYRTEVSTDLSVWRYNNDGTGGAWTVQVSATPLSAETESVVVRAGPSLTGAARVFYRVRAAMP